MMHLPTGRCGGIFRDFKETMASDVNGAIEVQAEVQAVRRMKNVTFVTANLRRRIEKERRPP
jgi:hypothetical protein